MKKLLTLALAVLMCVFAISAMADTVSIDRTLELQFVPSKDADVIITGTKNLPELLKAALLEQGYDVKVSEVHGMSQRGGSVVTYVRYGDSVASAVVDKGEADMIISFEKLESARWLPYLKKDGVLITNEQEIDPMTVIMGKAVYPEGILETLREMGVKTVSVPASQLAEEAGNVRAANLVLLGVASRFIDLEPEVWQAAIRATVPPKTVDVNLEAFAKGRACAE